MEQNGKRQARKLLKVWWPGTESNRRRQPFQGCALPPELPGHVRAAPLPDGCELWATPTLANMPGIAGSRNAGSVWNSPDYNNQVGFPQCAVVSFAVSSKTNLVNPLWADLGHAATFLRRRTHLSMERSCRGYAPTLQPNCRESATRKRAVFPAAPSDRHSS